MAIRSTKSQLGVLLIGGTGFIGSYVAKSLSEKGRPVTVLYRNLLNPKQMIKGVTYQKGFNKKNKNIDTVVIAPRPDPTTFAAVLGFLSRPSQLKKVVYLSTFGLYPDSLHKQKETAQIIPISQYQREKYYEEIALGEFAKRLGVKLCIARISNPYGDVKDKQIIGRVIKQLFSKNQSASPFLLNGNGKQLRDFIFIEDAAELISYLTICKQKTPIEFFNVCSGVGSSMDEVVGTLENLSGKKLMFKKNNPFPFGEKINSIGDNTKILLASKYRIRYSLVEGFKKTLDNYFKHT